VWWIDIAGDVDVQKDTDGPSEAAVSAPGAGTQQVAHQVTAAVQQCSGQPR